MVSTTEHEVILCWNVSSPPSHAVQYRERELGRFDRAKSCNGRVSKSSHDDTAEGPGWVGKPRGTVSLGRTGRIRDRQARKANSWIEPAIHALSSSRVR